MRGFHLRHYSDLCRSGGGNVLWIWKVRIPNLYSMLDVNNVLTAWNSYNLSWTSRKIHIIKILQAIFSYFWLRKNTEDLLTLETKSTAELCNHWLFSSACLFLLAKKYKIRVVCDVSSYQAMYSVYRRAANSLTIPFAFFPKYPPLLHTVRVISREIQPTMLPANDELNECVRSS
jgi:hypothetical protein